MNTTLQQIERLEKALTAPSTDFQYVQSLVRIIKQDCEAIRLVVESAKELRFASNSIIPSNSKKTTLSFLKAAIGTFDLSVANYQEILNNQKPLVPL